MLVFRQNFSGQRFTDDKSFCRRNHNHPQQRIIQYIPLLIHGYQAQFSVRTSDWKYIQQEDQTLVYQLSSDPKEEQNIKKSSDATVQKAQKEYNALIDAKSSMQKKVQSHQPNRHISDDECKRLEALGYTTCDQR